MKKIILILSLMLLAVSAYAGDYNYVSAEKVKDWIDSGAAVTIVDIQVKEEYRAHHLPGSIKTYSYPVKSDEDKAKLSGALSQVQKNNDPVVVVCPRGAGGAKRCYNYMKEQGVAESRLLILEKGMSGWPYNKMVEKE